MTVSPLRWYPLTLTLFALCGWLVSPEPRAVAAGTSPPLTTADLLVHLARDHQVLQGGNLAAGDVLYISALLEAALRLEPRQLEAALALYELALVQGDEPAAARYLTAALAADPNHQTIFAAWLSAGLRAEQTVESQRAWLERVLTTRRPPAHAALVQAELARLALEQRDLPAARAALAEALRLDPACSGAARLGPATLDAEAPLSERLAPGLRILTLDPLALDAAWAVALVLERARLHTEAVRYFDHAQYIQTLTSPGRALPAALVLLWAGNQRALGNLDNAVQLAAQAADDPLHAAEAGLLLHDLLVQMERPRDARVVAERLRVRFAAIADPRSVPGGELVCGAWFYCLIEPDVHRANLLADAAARVLPPSPTVRRTLGWSRMLADRREEALELLQPLASQDPYAAYAVARLLHEAGDDAAARTTLAGLTVPARGQAAQLIAQLEWAGGGDQPATAAEPAPQPDAAVAALLAEDPLRSAAFFDLPARALEARITLDDLSPEPGEPWWATFTLRNRADYAITFGSDAMLDPLFALSFRVEGDRQREFPALLHVRLTRVLALAPGQTVTHRQPLDVGPLRRLSRATPQHLQRIVIDGVLHPDLGVAGPPTPAPGGQRLPTVYFNRLPAPVGPEAMSALYADLRSTERPRRFGALERLAQLLGEQQRAELRRLTYQPRSLPSNELRAILRAALSDGDWETRVRALDGLQTTGLTADLATAVEACLEHPHWLVRLMAVRVAARQGSAFAERAATLARNDADELVRRVADSFARRLSLDDGAGTTSDD